MGTSPSTEIWHSTFSLNEAEKGAGVCSISSRVNINNSILHGNVSTVANYESVFRYSGRIYIKHSILEDNPCPFYKVYCTNNQYYDPEFVNPSNDFHIHPNSPAVDLGLNNSIVDDLDFQARPFGNGYDAGCYEVQTLPLRVQNNNPHENEISLYPNPVDQILRIRFHENFEFGNLSIKNTSGKLILQKVLNSESDQINIAHFSPGIYIIHIESNLGAYTKKIIKQ